MFEQKQIHLCPSSITKNLVAAMFLTQHRTAATLQNAAIPDP